MNIILMGYRGCGKTTIGRAMAEELWKEFVDTDVETIKKFDGRTIREIWETEGEPAFREAERDTVRDALAKGERVVALGGGAVMQPETRQWVADAHDALRIYLYCTPKELAKRIAEDPASQENRPPLPHGDDAEASIAKILAERGPIYESLADKTFEVTFTDVQTNMGNIIRVCL